MRADARGHAGMRGVDGDGVGCGARVLVVGYHLGEREVDGALGEDGRADETRGVSHHEGHLLRGDGFGGDD